MNKKKKIILIVILIIILIIFGLVMYTLINKDNNSNAYSAYISYDLNEECLEYVNNLEEVSYENIFNSDYANLLYLYNETYEASYCDEKICTADMTSSKEDYLVCINSVYLC